MPRKTQGGGGRKQKRGGTGHDIKVVYPTHMHPAHLGKASLIEIVLQYETQKHNNFEPLC
jgi:hypothetical protein